jgi:predicted ATPase
MAEARSILGPLRRYRLVPDQLRRPVSAWEAETPRIRGDGYGLAGLVHKLLTQRRDDLTVIEEQLRDALPDFQAINAVMNRFDTPEPGAPTYEDDEPVRVGQERGERFAFQIELVTKSDTRVPAEAISDGFFLLLGYLTLARVTDARILLVDEAETGVHPGLLGRVVKVLRELASGKHAPAVQVLLTTHSPILLNFVGPEEIRIVQRADGITRVHPFKSRADIDQLLEYQGPGELWATVKEEGLLAPSKSRRTRP